VLNAARGISQAIRHELLVAHGWVQSDAQQSSAIPDACAVGKANSGDTQRNRHMESGQGCCLNKGS